MESSQTLLQALEDEVTDDEILRPLVSTATVEEMDEDGRTALHFACSMSLSAATFAAILEQLKAAAATYDEDERLPLHYAVDADEPSMTVVQAILDVYPEGARAADTEGRLPLHVYMANDSLCEKAMVQLLLSRHKGAAQTRDDNGYFPIHLGLERGSSTEAVRALQEAFPDCLLEPDAQGNTPLHVALLHPADNTEILATDMLTACPSAAEVLNKVHNLPLHLAALRNLPASLVKTVHKAFPEAVSTMNHDGQFPIHCASKALQPNMEVVNLLLDWYPEGAAVTDKMGLCPIESVAGLKKRYCERLGIPEDADTGITTADDAAARSGAGAGAGAGSGAGSGSGAHAASALLPLGAVAGDASRLHDLILACEDGNEEALTLEVVTGVLKEDPGCVGCTDKDGDLPVHLVVSSPFSLDVIDLIMQANPSAVSRRDLKGRLPLHFAVGCEHPRIEVVQSLLSQFGEAAEKADSTGLLPLHFAVRSANPSLDVIKAVLASNHEAVLAEDADGRMPLHHASDTPDAQLTVVEALIAESSEAAASEDAAGMLPLHLAAQHGGVDAGVVEALIRAHPRAVDWEDSAGRYPVHYVLSCDPPQVEVFQLLVDVSAETLTKKDASGSLPIHLAVSHEHVSETIVDAIVDYDPTCLNAPDASGMLPLHLACAAGCDAEVIEALLAKQEGVPQTDRDHGRLPLHWACLAPVPDDSVVRALVEAFPDGPDIQDNAGHVAVEYAARNPASSVAVLDALCADYPQHLFVAQEGGESLARELVARGSPMVDLIRRLQNRRDIPEKLKVPLPPSEAAAPITPAHGSAVDLMRNPLSRAPSGDEGAGAEPGTPEAKGSDDARASSTASPDEVHFAVAPMPGATVESVEALRTELTGRITGLEGQVHTLEARIQQLDADLQAKKSCCCTIQ